MNRAAGRGAIEKRTNDHMLTYSVMTGLFADAFTLGPEFLL